MGELIEKQKVQLDSIKQENSMLSSQYTKMHIERDKALDETQYQR